MKLGAEVFALVALISAIPQYTCQDDYKPPPKSYLYIVPFKSANCKDGNGLSEGYRAHPKEYRAHLKDHGAQKEKHSTLREGYSPRPEQGYGHHPPQASGSPHGSHSPQKSGSPHGAHHPDHPRILLPLTTCVEFPMAKSYSAIQVSHQGKLPCQLSIFTGAGCMNDVRKFTNLGEKETCFDTDLAYGWLRGSTESSWSAYYSCDGEET